MQIVMFGVPGAFLPTCSIEHLPSYITREADFAARGIDQIACVSVNDAFVMDAWRSSLGVDNIFMLADGAARFANALGSQMDLSERNVGIRSRRFSMVIDNLKVSSLQLAM